MNELNLFTLILEQNKKIEKLQQILKIHEEESQRLTDTVQTLLEYINDLENQLGLISGGEDYEIQ